MSRATREAVCPFTRAAGTVRVYRPSSRVMVPRLIPSRGHMVAKLRQAGAMLAFLAFAASAASAQQATVTGRVTNEVGNPLPSASVFLDGMSLGTITRDDGRYTLTVPAARVNGQT